MAYSELKTVSKVIEMEKYFARFSNGLSVSCMPTTVDQPTFAVYTGATSVQGQTLALILCVSLSIISKNVNGLKAASSNDKKKIISEIVFYYRLIIV